MKIWKNIIGVVVISILSTIFVSEQSKSQTNEPDIKKFTINAEIAKVRGSYILRAEKPAEIFTVLNPDPEILDEFISKGQTARLEVQIVSGDNVHIKTINGQKYAEP